MPIERLDCKNNRIELPILGVTTEVETLKQALAEAEKKAAEERTERERLGGQYGEGQQKLQALTEKKEGLERDAKAQATELASAVEASKNAKAEAQKALQELEEMRKIAAGKTFSMQSRNIKVKYCYLPGSGVLQGRSSIYPAVHPTPPHSSGAKGTARRRGCSGLSILRPDTLCP